MLNDEDRANDRCAGSRHASSDEGTAHKSRERQGSEKPCMRDWWPAKNKDERSCNLYERTSRTLASPSCMLQLLPAPRSRPVSHSMLARQANSKATHILVLFWMTQQHSQRPAD